MGLIKTALKTAVAVKTAHYVHGRIQERQQASWADPAAGATAAPTPMPSTATAPPDARALMPDNLAMLSHLGELKASGVLTEAEFETQKARILAP
jgi:hypothetical protein